MTRKFPLRKVSGMTGNPTRHPQLNNRALTASVIIWILHITLISILLEDAVFWKSKHEIFLVLHFYLWSEILWGRVHSFSKIWPCTWVREIDAIISWVSLSGIEGFFFKNVLISYQITSKTTLGKPRKLV